MNTELNTNEIVRALRDAPNYNAGLGTSTLEDEAASLIESLQAQLTEKTDLLEATIAGQETLQKALNRRAQPENEPRECPAMERVEGGIPYCSDKQTACNGCQNAQPENEPLTLDELRQMGGEPVYCVDADGSGAWALVHTQDEVCTDANYGDWEFYCYGWRDNGKMNENGWLAYRRKPERSERDEVS